MLLESAKIGNPELRRDINKGVEPDSVKAIIALMPTVWFAANIAVIANASVGSSKVQSIRLVEMLMLGCFSAPIQTSLMALTVSRGKSPAAVSPDNITASVPSNTALATSITSARVGIGALIIDSIICVAVITTLFKRRAVRIMFFCTPTNRASPISTPKSPRATITTSEALTISSNASCVSTASARSTLATILALHPASFANRRA